MEHYQVEGVARRLMHAEAGTMCFSSVKLAFHDADTDTDTDTDILADFRARGSSTSRTRTRILADLSDTRRDLPREDHREYVRRDSRVYTCTVGLHDKLSCTRLQNYTIGASLMSVSVSVSVPWNSSFNRQNLLSFNCGNRKHVVFF